MFSGETATSMKSSVPVEYSVRVVLLDFKKFYTKRLIQSKISSVAFLPVEAKKREGTKNAVTGASRTGICLSTFQIVDTGEAIQVISGTEDSRMKMRTLHRPLRMALYDMELSYASGFSF